MDVCSCPGGWGRGTCGEASCRQTVGFMAEFRSGLVYCDCTASQGEVEAGFQRVDGAFGKGRAGERTQDGLLG